MSQIPSISHRKNTDRLLDWFFSFSAFVLGLFTIVLFVSIFVSCGDDDSDVNYQKDEDQENLIIDCVNRGGDPIYTSNEYGEPYFIVCDLTP